MCGNWQQLPLFPNITDEEIEDLFEDAFCEDDGNVKEDKKCECGADKIYGPNNAFHSDWCPLYKKDKK